MGIGKEPVQVHARHVRQISRKHAGWRSETPLGFKKTNRYLGAARVLAQLTAIDKVSIAQLAIEIFTQQRNHAPRNRLGGKSPADVTLDAKRPEHTRNAIEALARRLNREQIDADERWRLIADARRHFSELSAASEQKLKRQLIKYTVLDIVAAQSRFQSLCLLGESVDLCQAVEGIYSLAKGVLAADADVLSA